MKVFIADGSASVVERLTDLLEQVAGLELMGHAADVPAATDSVQELDPDVVILGLRMAKGNGLDLLKAIKITRPRTKIIIFTNFPYAQYRKKCLDAGADFFLDKAADFDQIPGIVLKLFDTGSDRPALKSSHQNAL